MRIIGPIDLAESVADKVLNFCNDDTFFYFASFFVVFPFLLLYAILYGVIFLALAIAWFPFGIIYHSIRRIYEAFT